MLHLKDYTYVHVFRLVPNGSRSIVFVINDPCLKKRSVTVLHIFVSRSVGVSVVKNVITVVRLTTTEILT